MGFRINTNVAALNAHSAAVMNNRNLDNSLARLSSGLRINKAADDASGLAIANSLRAQASSLGQAVNNGNDAIGLIQTADGALNEYSNILNTIKTKTVQAASDGQNTSSRLSIQKDINALLKELNVIAKTTSFNGQKLLSGTFANKEFQMGANANESAKVSIASTQTNQVGQTSRADLNLASSMGGNVQLTLKSATTGKSISLKNVDIQYNNNPLNGMGALADEVNRYSADTGITAKAIITTTAASAVLAGTTGSDFAINGIIIGAIQVSANDNDGTLLNAINGKTTQTGVSATMTTDGKLSLSSDGRSLKVSGGVGILGDTAKNLSTLGHLQMVQAGSAEFQVQGIGTGAVTNKLTTSASVTTVKDSTLASGSTIKSGSTLKAGTVVGGNVLTTAASITTTIDSNLQAGTIIASGSTLAVGTTIGGTVTQNADVTLTQDAFVTTGSTLKIGTILGAGTVMQQNFTDGTVNFTKGQVLNADYTTTASDLVLTADMTVAKGTTGKIKLGSTLQSGSVLGAATVQKSSVAITTSDNMTLKQGSTLAVATTLMAGSTTGGDYVVSGDTVTYAQTKLKTGSTLLTGSVVNTGSTIGGEMQVAAITATNFTQDMLVKAGSTLTTGTILAAGTVLQQDLTTTQTGSTAMSAGDVLAKDLTLGANVILSKDMVLLGSATATLAANSKLLTNTANSGSVGLNNQEFTNLSNIDVTTLNGAMKAIDTLSAAMTNLDTIRSDLGSVQNQVTSNINNISVTAVNVKAAESSIRDVDFAQESANFSKFNILAQSGSYAMSQANVVQKNVLRLLQ